jgi:hypothetical protein
MYTIMIKCPATGRWVSTGIDIEPSTFAHIPDVVAHAHCPACGREHPWTKRNAMISPFATSASQSGKRPFQL